MDLSPRWPHETSNIPVGLAAGKTHTGYACGNRAPVRGPLSLPHNFGDRNPASCHKHQNQQTPTPSSLQSPILQRKDSRAPAPQHSGTSSWLQSFGAVGCILYYPRPSHRSTSRCQKNPALPYQSSSTTTPSPCSRLEYSITYLSAASVSSYNLHTAISM
ncbi:hypothetical protein K432DRAFT_379966 [Lepidopterella palustris CBS 459.81]|uniref:Uncharacterized protein n=1 Tax=Lepidopterella palustris CBS 459.81 TaxID=1314670 RepID=A0A8E2JHL1_9PEZI|nr:hypothetical protein K432DRAFT_379966 [Lepidopterella palustris CBS 459.81]